MTFTWDPQQFEAGALSVGLDRRSVEAALAAGAAIKASHPDLPVVLSLGHLAHLTDVSAGLLDKIVRRRLDPYKVFRVKKRGTPKAGNAPARRYRTICVPAPGLMRVQRWIAQNILNVITPHAASYAFTPKVKMSDAVKRHANATWLVKVDVRHFFESITETQVYWFFRRLGYPALLCFELGRLCTRLAPDHRVHAKDPPVTPGSRPSSGHHLPYPPRLQGWLPQGAPTSPMLANHIVEPLDVKLSAMARSGGWRYTRYADDLHFSRTSKFTREAAVDWSHEVERELVRFGLRANRQKTTITPPGARALVLGALVDSSTPRLNRGFRNNVETHLFALTHPDIGVEKHQAKRGFASTIGMRRHVQGLIAFARQIDRPYGDKLLVRFESIKW